MSGKPFYEGKPDNVCMELKYEQLVCKALVKVQTLKTTKIENEERKAVTEQLKAA